jgi:hypothetical protein
LDVCAVVSGAPAYAVCGTKNAYILLLYMKLRYGGNAQDSHGERYG